MVVIFSAFSFLFVSSPVLALPIDDLIGDKPKLSVPIPGLQFSDKTIVQEGDTRKADLPWIAEYVGGVYNYAVGIAGILAAVMMMIGGFQYLTAGGDANRVSAGKKRITDALIGLFIALGAYLILSVINPALVEPSTLQLELVKRSAFENDLHTTTENTIGEDGGGSSEPGDSLGLDTNYFDGCPFSPGTSQSFGAHTYGPITEALTATTLRERILQAADAAVDCSTAFGSCGRTVSTINTLAGMNGGSAESDCLSEQRGCWTEGPRRRAISRTQRSYISGLRCGSNRNRSGPIPDREDCVSSGSEATTLVRNKLREEMNAGWPDSWVDELQPGDKIIVYNGNSSFTGSHTGIFTGFGSGGYVNVIHGSAGRDTARGRMCVRTSCGDRMRPLVYVAPVPE